VAVKGTLLLLLTKLLVLDFFCFNLVAITFPVLSLPDVYLSACVRSIGDLLLSAFC
jgi:hypothetical protein